MNTSKFLKKSLAMLLAILMVVAMIPLSAFATDTEPAPDDPAPATLLAPTVTVNNRNATKPENAEGSYSATVEDATTVSIAWVPETGVTAKLKTEREVEVNLPFYRLDLTQEAELTNYDEATKTSTYEVTLIFKKGTEAAVEYPLIITSRTEAASDDVTLKAVKPNQSFQIGSTTYTFNGIKGEFTGDEEITITLPLGWNGQDAGFASGNFGGSGQNLSSISNTQTLDQLVSKVFVPTASYSTVRYTSNPVTVTGGDSGYAMTGTVTVTARDGRSKNYTVKFAQEAALTDVKVRLVNNAATSVREFPAESFYLDTDNNWTYVVPVDSDFYNGTTKNGTVLFGHGDNVVRVEDPSTTTAGTYDANVWTNAHTSEDEPVLNDKNTFVFNTNRPTGDSAVAGGVSAYLTVKTEANMATNSANVDAMLDGDNNGKFYANVRIVLVDKSNQTNTPTGAPKLYELQLNGYESIWNKGEEIGTLNEATGMREITVNVDNEFQYGNGDDVHPARISLLATNGAKITIPAQAPGASSVNPYWVVNEKTANGAVDLEYGTYGRIDKPNAAGATNPPTAGKAFIDNVNVEGHSFILRVTDPSNANNYTEYKVNVNQPQKNDGVDVAKATLYWYDDTVVPAVWRTYEATKSATNKNFQFELPDDLYDNTVTAGTPAVLGAITGTQGNIIGTTTPTGNTDEPWVHATLAITADGGGTTLTTDFKAAVNAAIGIDADAATVELGLRHANNATDFELVATTKDGTPAIIKTVKVADVVAPGTPGLAYDVKIGSGANIKTVGTVTFGGSLWNDAAVGGAKAEALTAADLTAANLNAWFATAVKPTGWSVAVTTAAVDGTSSLNTNFINNCYLDLDVPHGAVVTPGASLKTEEVGTSLWGADQYGSYPAVADDYTELEEGVTSMGDWWKEKYLRTSNNSAAYSNAGTKNDPGLVTDMLYFTVANGRPTGNVRSEVYTISLVKENTNTPGSTLSTAYELSYSGATNAVDEDLIYGGNTVTNSILDRSDTANPGAVPTPNPAAAWQDWIRFDGDNPGSIDYADAQYVGAVNAKNTYNVTETTDPVNSKAKILTIEVPENFLSDPATFQKIVFESFTFPTGALVYPMNSTKTAFMAYSPKQLTARDQSQQAITPFTFTADDLNAWNGNTFIAANVTNVLYVFSAKTASDNSVTGTTSAWTARANADAIYYITVKRVADKTADTLNSVTAKSEGDKVTATVNKSRKVVTISVPYSYNWIGSRDNESADFTLDFDVAENATLVDAYRDAAFKFRKQDPSNIWPVPQNFDLADLVEQQQDLFSLSDKTSTYFVKGGELYVYNPNTGAETQITGMGNGIDDAFINRAWGLIKTREAELRVYPETRENVNTYKLELQIRERDESAVITGVMVDETEAKIEGTNIVAEMPAGYIPTAVRLSISVGGMTKIVSVAGEPYDPNENKLYDLTNPIKIVVESETGGNRVEYTLSTETIEPTPTPTPTTEPTPTPGTKLPVDIDDVHSSMRAEVIKAIENGLMQGGPDNHFYPNNTMKRYEFALVVARAGLRAEGETGTAAELDQKLVAEYASCDFADVTAMNNAAVSAAVQYVFEKGYMKGISDTAFSPNGNITRQEAALTMARVAGLSLEDTDATTFTDNAKIASWAIGGVNAVVEAGIMQGDASNNTFAPTRSLTRAEGACILVRYFVDGKGQQPEPEDPTPDDDDDPSTPDDGDDTSTPDDGDSSSTPDDGDDNTTGDDDTTGDDSSSSTPAE